MGHSVVEHDNRQDSPGQGQDDLEQIAQVGNAVDTSGLEQFVGDGVLEVGPHDDHIVDTDATRQDDGPTSVGKAQLGHQNIVGNHATGEEHNDHEQGHIKIFTMEIPARQWVGGHNGQDNIQRRGHHGVENGVGIAFPYQLIAKNDLIAGEGKIHRPQ